MKKILFIILVLTVTFGVSPSVCASEQPNIIAENEAIELARWFIANDIYENNNNGWSENTVIESVENDGDRSYVVKLESNSKNNGYIVVSKKISDSLIKEFAYEGEPLFVNLIPIHKESIRLSLYSSDNRDIADQTNENLPYLLKVRKNLKMVKAYRDYGNITNPYSHVNSTYGSGWSYHSGNTIFGFTTLNMSIFLLKNIAH